MQRIRQATAAALALMTSSCASNPLPGKPAIGMEMVCYPKAVGAGEGAAWAVLETDAESSAVAVDYTLTKIEQQTGRMLNVVDLGTSMLTHPVLTTGFGAVWLALGEHVNKIDHTTAETLVSVELSPPASRFNWFDGIAAGLGAVWVTRVVLFRLDPATAQVVATVRLPGKAGQVTTGAGAVWVLTPNGVSRVDPDTNREVLSIPLNLGTSRRIVFAASNVWVFDGRGRLARIDPRANQIVNSVVVDSVEHVLPADDTSVWILQKTRSVPKYRLLEVDTAANRIRSEHPIGNWNSNEPLTSDAAERTVWLCVDGRLRRLLLPNSPTRFDAQFTFRSDH